MNQQVDPNLATPTGCQVWGLVWHNQRWKVGLFDGSGMELTRLSSSIPAHWLVNRTHCENYPGFVPLLEHTDFGKSHPFHKLLYVEPGLLPINWGFALCMAHVHQIITHIINIIFIVAILDEWGQLRNRCKIGFLCFW
jgi:hypothetical protein